MNPCIPYGWQEAGKYIGILPQKSKSINVFGLLSSDNHFHSYHTHQSINSDLVIALIDNFVQKMKQPTVIVLDNASIHRSQDFEAKLNQWEQQDLYIFFLPKYSPHLNRIETLWRKIKYEWLKPHHYFDWKTFSEALKNILANIGKKFIINFKEQKMSIIYN